jgi:hypothetical protein
VREKNHGNQSRNGLTLEYNWGLKEMSKLNVTPVKTGFDVQLFSLFLPNHSPMTRHLPLLLLDACRSSHWMKPGGTSLFLVLLPDNGWPADGV